MHNTRNIHQPKSLRNSLSYVNKGTQFNSTLARQAIIAGLVYLKNQLGWSETKIAKILHLPQNTLTHWFQNKSFPPIESSISKLSPNLQAALHLLAIHRNLEAMFETADYQRAWLSTFHPELNTIPEQCIAKSIKGLIFIRKYLDFVCH